MACGRTRGLASRGRGRRAYIDSERFIFLGNLGACSWWQDDVDALQGNRLAAVWATAWGILGAAVWAWLAGLWRTGGHGNFIGPRYGVMKQRKKITIQFNRIGGTPWERVDIGADGHGETSLMGNLQALEAIGQKGLAR